MNLLLLKFNRHRLTRDLWEGYDKLNLEDITITDIRRQDTTNMALAFVVREYDSEGKCDFYQIERQIDFSVTSVTQAKEFIGLLSTRRDKKIISLKDVKDYYAETGESYYAEVARQHLGSPLFDRTKPQREIQTKDTPRTHKASIARESGGILRRMEEYGAFLPSGQIDPDWLASFPQPKEAKETEGKAVIDIAMELRESGEPLDGLLNKAVRKRLEEKKESAKEEWEIIRSHNPDMPTQAEIRAETKKNNDDLFEKLKELAELKEKGLINEEEFQLAKDKLFEWKG